MAELLGVHIRIGGLWHAGSYDPHDFLGRLIGKAKWVRHAEKSMFHCYDQNFFATDFHIRMFVDNLLEDGFKSENPWYEEDFNDYISSGKIVRVGWPMEYLRNSLDNYKGMTKRDLILFPHRIAPEKQVDIFRDLAEQLPEYEFVICQERELTKNEYHNLLGEAKLVFSANLQETLGISWYEGALVDAIPMVPDRLSYSEMALPEFKYPSAWTEDFASYRANRDKVVAQVREYIEHYDSFMVALDKQRTKLNKDFFSGAALYDAIKRR
jgi:glycosyltransferase involved in cell wall biosynthesis